MPTDIIQTQKEVARKAMKRIETEVEYDATQWNNMLVWEAGDYDTVQTIIEDAIAEAIANIGRELEAQLKEKSYIPWDHYHDTEADKAYIDLENALTIVRSITGISPTR